MTNLVDGKKIADQMLDEIAEKVKIIKKPLKMATVLVGNNPKSRKFLELKKKAGEEVGISVDVHELPLDIKTLELSAIIHKLSQSDYSGVLLELPLPEPVDLVAVLNSILVQKDVDVLSFEAQEKFYSGNFSILPPAVEAVKSIFGYYKIEPKGKKAAVFGQGILVGKPVSFWLEKQGSIVATIDEFTKNPEIYSKETDILVSGVGKPNLITEDMVKEGAVVIDFGHDVDFESVSKKASLITPPTGGVGPIVVAAVLKNLVDLNLS